MAFINRWVLTAWAKPWVPFRLSREHDGSSGSQVPSHRRFNVGVIVVHGATAAIKDHGNKLIKMSLPIHPTRIAWRFSHTRPSHLPRPTRPPLRNMDSPRPLPHLQSTWPHLLFLEIRLRFRGRVPENKLRARFDFGSRRIWRIRVLFVLINWMGFRVSSFDDWDIYGRTITTFVNINRLLISNNVLNDIRMEKCLYDRLFLNWYLQCK